MDRKAKVDCQFAGLVARLLITVLFPLLLACAPSDSGGDGKKKSSDSKAGSDEAPLPPTAPTGVSATAGDAKVTISWTAVTDATSYNLYWIAGTAQGITTKDSGTQILGVTSPSIHTGLTNGIAYSHVVTAANSNGESSPSTVVYATPIAATTSLIVYNYYSFTITELYVSPSGSAIWGTNQLGVSTIPYLGQFTLTSIPCPAVYDLKVIASNAAFVERFAESFVCGITKAWSIF